MFAYENQLYELLSEQEKESLTEDVVKAIENVESMMNDDRHT